MFCPKCGIENLETARQCSACGSSLAAVERPPGPAPAPAPLSAATVGRALSDSLNESLRGTSIAANVGPDGKLPWVAAGLSFCLWGLGQVYNEDFKKAAAVFIGAMLGFWIGGLAVFVVWVWGMVDAWRVASGLTKRW